MLSQARHPLLGRIAAGTLAAGAALSLSACGLPLLPPAFSGDTDAPSPAADPEPTETAEPFETEEPDPIETEPEGFGDPDEQDVNVLIVGDCLNEMEVSADDTVDTVPIVDCADPHDLEVYYGGTLDEDGPYPGDEDASEMVNEGCVDAFEDFVGIPYEDSILLFQTLYPGEDSWEAGNRDYLCLVGDEFEQTTGTLEDSNL